MDNLDLQRALRAAGYYTGTVDAKIGKASKRAIVDFLSANKVGYHRWGDDRRLLAAKQLAVKLAGIETGVVDGLMGPSTRYAFERWSARQIGKEKEVTEWRDHLPPPVQQQPVLKPIWPRQAEVTRFYGEPGTNQTMLVTPFPLRIAWERRVKINRFSIHEKCHDSALRVLTRVADAYDHSQRQSLGLDLFGGCLNVRRMRGGTAWSMHSWGIAIDFDPERNQLKWGRDKARLAQADCVTFWRLWEEEGWLSLGRARNYDWMHVQAARL